jgi:penicillin-binding protein 2
MFAEKDLGLPGVHVSVKPVREYVYDAMAAQILGYVGRNGRHQQPFGPQGL